jgi:hypothetical protein
MRKSRTADAGRYNFLKEDKMGIVEALGGEWWFNLYAGIFLACCIINGVSTLFDFLKKL